MDSLILRLRHGAASATVVMRNTVNVGRLLTGMDVGVSDAVQCSSR
jgi:hypothetical protein